MNQVGSAVTNGVGGAVGGAINTGLGLLFGNAINKQQQENQQVLLNQQEAANEKLSAFNMGEQLDMWNKTNYEAQVAHLKAAGLNPALLYAKGGPGGTTGSPSGGVGMGIAPGSSVSQTAATIQAAEQQNLQTENQKAQINLMNAEAEKAKADATKTAGVDTDVAGQQWINLKQQWDNTELDMTMKNILNYEQQASQDDRLEKIHIDMMQALDIAKTVANQRGISDATYNSTIATIKAGAIAAVLHNSMTKAGIANTEADTQLKSEQVTKLINEIAQGWTELNIKDKAQKAQELLQTMQANNPSMWNVIGGELNRGIEDLWRILPGSGQRIWHTPKK